MNFIKLLEIDKKILKKQFYEDSIKAHNSIPKNQNIIFCQLVSELHTNLFDSVAVGGRNASNSL